MVLMGLIFDLLWICGAASLLFYLFHEIKHSEKELGSFNCQYLSLTIESWLVLTVITNASGWMILSSRFLEFPHSWFTAMVLINTSRLIFQIKPTMPIILDLGWSLILQWVISWGIFGWRWAFSLVFTLMIVIFYNGYFGVYFDEYMRLRKENPKARRRAFKELKQPLSPGLLAASLIDIFVVNGCLLLTVWLYPWDDRYYQFSRESIGFVLVIESFLFLSCYQDLCSKGEGLTVPKGETGKPQSLPKET